MSDLHGVGIAKQSFVVSAEVVKEKYRRARIWIVLLFALSAIVLTAAYGTSWSPSSGSMLYLALIAVGSTGLWAAVALCCNPLALTPEYWKWLWEHPPYTPGSLCGQFVQQIARFTGACAALVLSAFIGALISQDLAMGAPVQRISEEIISIFWLLVLTGIPSILWTRMTMTLGLVHLRAVHLGTLPSVTQPPPLDAADKLADAGRVFLFYAMVWGGGLGVIGLSGLVIQLSVPLFSPS